MEVLSQPQRGHTATPLDVRKAFGLAAIALLMLRAAPGKWGEAPDGTYGPIFGGAQPHIRRQSRALFVGALITLFSLVFFAACKREQRQFQSPPSTYQSVDVTLSDIQPGAPAPAAARNNPSDQRAYDANEGKRLFTQYNCSGCHFNGGGGIGPPLMDQLWIYGEKPENIYATIIEGRPNGMPSFRHKIPDSQVWQLVSYVRSLSGQLRKDVAPSRSDDMTPKRSEQRTKREAPKGSGVPPSAQHP